MRLTAPLAAILFTRPQRDGSIAGNNDKTKVLNDDSGSTLENIPCSAVRASLKNNLHVNDTRISNQTYDQPFDNEQNSNSMLAIISSNWRVEHHDMV